MPSIKCHQASASQARGPQGHPRWEMSFPSASRPSPTASQLCCVAAERGPPVHELSLVTVPPASRFWTPRRAILWITRRKIHHFLAGNCGAPQCWEQSPATELCFLFAPPKLLRLTTALSNKPWGCSQSLSTWETRTLPVIRI